MFNINNKRLLQSPEETVSNPKLIRTSNMNQNNPLPLEEDTTSALNTDQMMPLEPREQLLLQSFAKLVGRELESKFISFSQTELQPMKENISDLKSNLDALRNEIEFMKEEKSDLSKKLELYEDKLSLLDKESRDYNLVFYNIPKTSEIHSSLIDLCKEILKVSTPISIKKTIILRDDKSKNSMNVLAKFESTSMVDAILKCAKNLKGANTGITITRDYNDEDRKFRRTLLSVKKNIKQKDTSDKFKVNVVGTSIYINNHKFNYNKKSNKFGNREVDGKVFLKEHFSIDFDSFVLNQQ